MSEKKDEPFIITHIRPEDDGFDFTGPECDHEPNRVECFTSSPCIHKCVKCGMMISYPQWVDMGKNPHAIIVGEKPGGKK